MWFYLLVLLVIEAINLNNESLDLILMLQNTSYRSLFVCLHALISGTNVSN